MKQVLKPRDYNKLEKIIKQLAIKNEISIADVMEITHKSRVTAWRYMQILVDSGTVELNGNTNNAMYRVKK